MDWQLIEQKLESLRRALERIKKRCPATAKLLHSDIDAQDILSLNLSRAIQLCVDISAHIIAESGKPPPETMGEAFQVLNASGIIEEALMISMKKAVGFRNIAVHNYDAINWDIVFSIATRQLQDFDNFAKAVFAIKNGH